MSNIDFNKRICNLFSLTKNEWITVIIVAAILLYFYYKIFPDMYSKRIN